MSTNLNRLRREQCNMEEVDMTGQSANDLQELKQRVSELEQKIENLGLAHTRSEYHAAGLDNAARFFKTSFGKLQEKVGGIEVAVQKNKIILNDVDHGLVDIVRRMSGLDRRLARVEQSLTFNPMHLPFVVPRSEFPAPSGVMQPPSNPTIRVFIPSSSSDANSSISIENETGENT